MNEWVKEWMCKWKNEWLNGNQESRMEKTPDSGHPRPMVATGYSPVGDWEWITFHHREWKQFRGLKFKNCCKAPGVVTVKQNKSLKIYPTHTLQLPSGDCNNIFSWEHMVLDPPYSLLRSRKRREEKGSRKRLIWQKLQFKVLRIRRAVPLGSDLYPYPW